MKFRILITVIILILIAGCGGNEQAKGDAADSSSGSRVQAETARKIYIVQSYSPEHICGKPQEIGIKNAFHEKNILVKWKSFYMFSKLRNKTEGQIEEQAALAIKEIEQFAPDIVYLLDDNAIRALALKLIDKPYFVIFSGMNGQVDDYNKDIAFLDSEGTPVKNMTGVYEYLHSSRSINTMHQLFPEMTKIVAIIDKTPTGDAVAKQLELENLEDNVKVDVEMKRISTMAEYDEEIKKINQDNAVGAVYNVALSLEGFDGNQVGVPVTFKYFLEHSKKPGVALNYAFSKLGLFGGAAVNFMEMGKQAGRMGIRLIQGEDIKNIKVESDKKYMLVFNKARAKQLGIEIPKELEMVADVIYDKIALLEK